MTEPNMTAVMQRLERLERETRWWRGAGILSLMVLGAFVVMGQAPTNPRVVEARKFVLRDAAGRIRAVLGAEPAGQAPTGSEALPGWYQNGLHFYGEDGAYRAGLREAINPSETWELEMQAKNTPTSVRLVAADGLAALSLYATAQSRAAAEREDREWARTFNAAKSGEEQANLLANRKVNGVQASLSAFPSGASSLTVKHGLGGGLDFYLLKRQSTLYITDESGVSRAVLGQTKLDHPATGVVEERPISSIVLFDKTGKVTWKAP